MTNLFVSIHFQILTCFTSNFLNCFLNSSNFCCSLANSTVHHIVSQALCIAMEDSSMVSAEDFYFKIEGRQEYLLGLVH